VSSRIKLTAEELQKVDEMFVKARKIGGHSCSREKSGTWSYFGELCYRLVRFFLLITYSLVELRLVTNLDCTRHYQPVKQLTVRDYGRSTAG